MPYYSSQGQADASLWAAAIEAIGKNLSSAMLESVQMNLQTKGKEAALQREGLQQLTDWVKNTSPEQRTLLLKDPAFRNEIMNMVNPRLTKPKKGEKQQGVSEETVLGLAKPTVEEEMKQAKLRSDLDEQKAKTQRAQSEAVMAETKEKFATGEKRPSAMDLITNFDFKDPIAATLMTQVPPDTLKDIALNEKKAGPLYEKTQQQDYYKWGLEQGWSPGLAMTTASAIAKGEWNKVPETWKDPDTGKIVLVRGMAEQKLALDVMNANTQRQSVQNTIQSSIATSAASLAEKSGLTLDQARANVVAMRSGKAAPFPTPMLTEHVQNDLIIQNQEMQKNAQTILNDKFGISTIRESLNTLLSAYKEESGTFSNSAAANDLKDKIVALQENLSQRLGERYGVKLPEYQPSWISGAVKSVSKTVWDGMKATGAWTADNMKMIDDAIQSTLPEMPNDSYISSSPKAVPKTLFMNPKERRESANPPVTKHTPEQENILKNLYQSLGAALANDQVPADQKDQIQKYIREVLEPAYADPSKFNNLFKVPSGMEMQ